ncbi:MAG: hypothetical protein NTY83_01550 [Candidatus Micrarchaeota archaeon]|nr:hypothetical protein [Candidatus Micrarchaeota archaeon]
MQSINQENPLENNIRMLMLHSLFWPDEAKRAESRDELNRMVWENPTLVERVALAYMKSLLGMREVELGRYEKMIDGRHPGTVFDADQEGRMLALLRDVRREAKEARLSRVNDRKEAAWAKREAREKGTPVSLRIH